MTHAHARSAGENEYSIELVLTPRGRLIAYIVQNGKRVAVSKKPVSAEEARQLADDLLSKSYLSNNHQQQKRGICKCGGMLFKLQDESLFCLNCTTPEGEP